jgi:predicted secreted protein
MTITAALVMFAVTWFMVFFVVLQVRNTSQADAGEVVPGTPRGAPAGFVIKRKAKITTLVSVVVWAVLCGIILSGKITVRDFDWMNRMPPINAQGQ